MTTLILTVLRSPDRVAPEIRRVEAGQYVLGRATGADWVLAEPGDAPQLSRRHCTLSGNAGSWTLTDTSTNGTMLNGERAPRGTPTRVLRAGDRLRLGEYEIEISFGAAAFQAVQYDQSPFHEAAFPVSAFGNAGSHAFGNAAPGASNSPFGSFGEPPLHENQLHEPQPYQPQPYQPQPYQPGSYQLAPHDHRPHDDSGPPSVRLPEGFASELFEAPAGRPPAQSDHTPAHDDVIRPPMARMVLPAEWDAVSEASRVLRVSAGPMPAMVEPPRSPTVSDGLLDAFLEGAGMQASPRPADAIAAMRAAGNAFRAFVYGLRRALMARAEIKSAFRIDQTMVRPRHNNPLKFAAGDEDALAALFGNLRHTDMTAAQAVEEALADIRLHELATMAAMQEAVQEMLGKLDPAKFLNAVGSGGLLPAKRRTRAFDLYEAEFLKLRETFREKFDDAFGQSFARAYERVVHDLRRKEPRA